MLLSTSYIAYVIITFQGSFKIPVYRLMHYTCLHFVINSSIYGLTINTVIFKISLHVNFHEPRRLYLLRNAELLALKVTPVLSNNIAWEKGDFHSDTELILGFMDIDNFAR